MIQFTSIVRDCVKCRLIMKSEEENNNLFEFMNQLFIVRFFSFTFTGSIFYYHMSVWYLGSGTPLLETLWMFVTMQIPGLSSRVTDSET